MTYIDIVFPCIIGVALLSMPRFFTKSQGELYRKTKRRLQMIGGVLIAVSSIYALVTVVSPAKEPPPAMEMHRQSVSVKDASGWYPAESTLGGFSVLMPIPFSDYSVHSQRVDGASMRIDCIGGKSTEGFKFIITAGSWFPKKPMLKELYEGFKKDGKVLSEPKYSELAVGSSVTFEAAGKDTGAWIRYTLTQSMLFSAIVEYPIGQREILANHAEVFLNSLKIERPNKSVEATTTADMPAAEQPARQP